MKKMTKRVASFFLALALILTTVLAMPASADAATKSKSKKATLKVTDTKISGFKTHLGKGTVRINSFIKSFFNIQRSQPFYHFPVTGRIMIYKKSRKLLCSFYRLPQKIS